MSTTVEEVHEDPDVFFAQARRKPSAALRGLVLDYTGYRHRGHGSYRRREPAQDRVTVILCFGPRLRVAGPGFEEVEVGSFVAPLADSYAVTTEGESLHGLQIDFSALGARMLFGLPMSELDGLVLDLGAALGTEASRLAERIYLAPGWDARFELLDAFFVARAAAATPPPPDVAWAWGRLAATRGRLAVGSLAVELGCSRRHLSARFREQVGIAPKAAARIMRFRHASELLSLDDGRRFAEIAQECGYCDQAHLNRDFRALAGTTPGDFVAKALPGGFGVAA